MPVSGQERLITGDKRGFTPKPPPRFADNNLAEKPKPRSERQIKIDFQKGNTLGRNSKKKKSTVATQHSEAQERENYVAETT